MARRNALLTRFSNTISYTDFQRRIIRPYSASALAGVALTAHRFGASCVGTSLTAGLPKYAPKRSLALVSNSSVFLPIAARLPAIAAATVLRPTPPFPTPGRGRGGGF